MTTMIVFIDRFLQLFREFPVSGSLKPQHLNKTIAYFVLPWNQLLSKSRKTWQGKSIRQWCRITAQKPNSSGKLNKIRKEKALLQLKRIYQSSKKMTSEDKMQKAGERAFAELEREIR